jgi:hypothetical protein
MNLFTFGSLASWWLLLYQQKTHVSHNLILAIHIFDEFDSAGDASSSEQTDKILSWKVMANALFTYWTPRPFSSLSYNIITGSFS